MTGRSGHNRKGRSGQQDRTANRSGQNGTDRTGQVRAGEVRMRQNRKVRTGQTNSEHSRRPDADSERPVSRPAGRHVCVASGG